jgi:hypothetical protein
MSLHAQSLSLWFTSTDGAPAHKTAAAAALSASGGLVTADAADAAAVLFARRRAGHVGVLVVGLVAEVARNGIGCAAGVHPLRHGDRIVVGAQTIHVAADLTVASQPYDPAQHGDEQFCARSKARLVPGEAVVVCPGTPLARCGTLFQAAAWALGLRCHLCGFDPKAKPWQPPRAAAVRRWWQTGGAGV